MISTPTLPTPTESPTHHALAEVIGVDAWQGTSQQRQDMSVALRVAVAGGHQAAGHPDHAAEGGGERVRLCQRLHGHVRPAGGGRGRGERLMMQRVVRDSEVVVRRHI